MSEDVVARVVRLDGSVDEIKKTKPTNPNFVPRKAWPGGNITVTNKSEALRKFYQRKKLPLPPELKAELGKEEERRAERAARFGRAPPPRHDDGATRAKRAAGVDLATAMGSASVAAPSSRRRGLPAAPRGDVKVISSFEGGLASAMAANKRPAERPALSGLASAMAGSSRKRSRSRPL